MHCTDNYSQQSWIISSIWLNCWVFESRCRHLNFRYCACFNQGFPWHSGIFRVCIHSERRTNMIRTHSQVHHTCKYSQHSSIICPILENGWVFVYELSGCGFESRCIYLTFRYCPCFEQGVRWYLRSADLLWNAYVTWWEHTVESTVQISTHKTAPSFGSFD